MHSPVNLLSLPVEVRLIIYSFIFADDWTYFNSCDPTSEPFQIQDPPDRLPPLLRTCQLLRREAAASYYSSLQVHFDIYNGIIPTEFINWLDNIGETNAALLQQFEIRWGNYADISLDLRHKPSKPRSTSKSRSNQSDTILIQTYHRRLSALLQQHRQRTTITSKPSSSPSPHHTNINKQLFFIPLLQLSPTTNPNPTTSFQNGTNHTLTIKGVPLSTPAAILPAEFWEINGTAEFCRILAKSLSDWLEDRLNLNLTSSSKWNGGGGRRGFVGIENIVEFVSLVDEHASALRWLGFW
ncbi:hypothetical protein BST61_g6237 [Cercospora zeina]